MKKIRNIFTLKKELNYTAIINKRNIFQLGKETKAIKHRIIRDIKNLFKQEQKEEDYYESVRGSNFWSKNYIEYESKGRTNKKTFS